MDPFLAFGLTQHELAARHGRLLWRGWNRPKYAGLNFKDHKAEVYHLPIGNKQNSRYLGQVDWVQWQEERRQLGKLRQTRVLQLRFRQQPESHLAALEARLVKLSLPP
jgi:hypothetical protein